MELNRNSFFELLLTYLLTSSCDFSRSFSLNSWRFVGAPSQICPGVFLKTPSSCRDFSVVFPVFLELVHAIHTRVPSRISSRVLAGFLQELFPRSARFSRGISFRNLIRILLKSLVHFFFFPDKFPSVSLGIFAKHLKHFFSELILELPDSSVVPLEAFFLKVCRLLGRLKLSFKKEQ